MDRQPASRSIACVKLQQAGGRAAGRRSGWAWRASRASRASRAGRRGAARGRRGERGRRGGRGAQGTASWLRGRSACRFGHLGVRRRGGWSAGPLASSSMDGTGARRVGEPTARWPNGARAGPDLTGLDRTGLDRAGPDGTRPDRATPRRTEAGRAGPLCRPAGWLVAPSTAARRVGEAMARWPDGARQRRAAVKADDQWTWPARRWACPAAVTAGAASAAGGRKFASPRQPEDA